LETLFLFWSLQWYFRSYLFHKPKPKDNKSTNSWFFNSLHRFMLTFGAFSVMKHWRIKKCLFSELSITCWVSVPQHIKKWLTSLFAWLNRSLNYILLLLVYQKDLPNL
jgi:hypothetical protein